MTKNLSSSLLLALVALMGIGLVQVYSSSFIYATESFQDGQYFFLKQLMFVGAGIVCLFSFAQIPFDLIRSWGWLLWLGAALGICLTLIPGVGVKVGGAHRWIQIFSGFRLEPAEFLKMAFPLLFASFFVGEKSYLNKMPLLLVMILVCAPLGLLLRQPDFGSFAIIVSVAVILLFVVGLRWRYILLSFLIMIPSFAYLIFFRAYRKARIMAYLDPWSDPDQKGFQLIQSMMSFSNGGLLGSGLGQGQGKLFFLPEAHTDFTLAVFGEEGGFVGFLLLLSLYGFVIYKGFQLGLAAKDQFCKVLAIGISTTFAISVMINVGVVLGLLPTKGLTLPFLSYGGSHIIALCVFFGILLNLEKQIGVESHTGFGLKAPRKGMKWS